MRWDIFCTVIDNYGDIGVCWRLARQLAQTPSLQVRLWVDDCASFTRLCPASRLGQNGVARQSLEQVEVAHWRQPFGACAPAEVADVVIEAFACSPPEPYLEAMAQRSLAGRPPVWINLEYLSAESWVEAHHGMVSPHPRLPLVKHFVFPGFTSRTGGVLRASDAPAPPTPVALPSWQTVYDFAESALPDAPSTASRFPERPGALRLSLFCYENHALSSLLAAWQGHTTDAPTPAIDCLVPEGRALQAVCHHLGIPCLSAGQSWQTGQLRLLALPFVSQAGYDSLLHDCDINFVRGEDSFVRAQWASRPFIWHIYPQEDDVHFLKLSAFLERYTTSLPPAARQAVTTLWQSWNRQKDCTVAWHHYLDHLPVLSAHGPVWAAHLRSQGDLADWLQRFAYQQLTSAPTAAQQQ